MTDPAAEEFPPLEFGEMHTDEKPLFVAGASSHQKVLNRNYTPSQPSDAPLLPAEDADEDGDVQHKVEPIQQSQPGHRDVQFEETLYRGRHVEIEVPIQPGCVNKTEASLTEHQDVLDEEAPLIIPRAAAPVAYTAHVMREGGDEHGDDREADEEDADDSDLEYEGMDDEVVDEDDIALMPSQRRRGKRNALRRRAPPRRLSFSQSESLGLKKNKRCKRIECENWKTRNWHTGPDGPGTLCYNCYMRYRDRRLVVYMNKDTGKLSVSSAEGTIPMRVIGFEPRERDNCNDMNKPKVVRLGNSEQDMRLLHNSKVNGKLGSRKRRKSKEIVAKEPGKPFARMGGGGTKSPAEGLAEGEGLYVKAEWRSDMRRFRVPHGIALHAFREEIRRVFQWKKEQLFCVTFMDQRGDYVRLGDENKMQEMFQMIARHQMFPLRLRIIS